MSGNIVARLLKVERALERATTPEGALETMLNGQWTWEDVCLATEEEEITRFRQIILDDAWHARQRREAGEKPWLGLPTQAAAEIVSYTPDEVPPDDYRRLIEQDILQLHDFPAITEPRFLQACVTMVALRTPDAMALRIQRWTDTGETARQTTPNDAKRHQTLPDNATRSL